MPKTSTQEWICIECGTEVTADHQCCTSCGAPSDPLLERVIAGKYKLIRKIAGGGMGIVYLAEHTRLKYKKYRAVKILREHLLHEPTLRKRFLREVELTHLVSQDNPHIVHIHDDYGFEKGIGFYVMEYLEGDTLEVRIQDAPNGLPLKIIRHIGLQICHAMESIHQADIIHRDLKPANIFLVNDKEQQDFVKIMDFGIAKAEHAGTQHTKEGSILGTAQYLSPEQIRQAVKGKKIDNRSDLYSLGCILFEMATGHPPFVLDSTTLDLSGSGSPMALQNLAIKHLSEPPPSPLARRPDLPPSFADFIQFRMLAKFPEQRPDNIDEIKRVLDALPTSTNHQTEHSLPTSTIETSDTVPSQDLYISTAVIEASEATRMTPLPHQASHQHHPVALHEEPTPAESHPNQRKVSPKIRPIWFVLLIFFISGLGISVYAWKTSKNSILPPKRDTSTLFRQSVPDKRRVPKQQVPKRQVPKQQALKRQAPKRRVPKRQALKKQPNTNIRKHYRKKSHRRRRKPRHSRWKKVLLRAPKRYFSLYKLVVRPRGVSKQKGKYLLVKRGQVARIKVQSKRRTFGFYRCSFSLPLGKSSIRLQKLTPKSELSPDSLDYCLVP